MRTVAAFVFLLGAINLYGQTISVMSYNIRYDNPGDGVNRWENRITKVTGLIAKYDPDVIGLQEALKHQINDITKGLPQYRYVGVGRDDGREKGEYSAILYKTDKFEVVTHSTSWLSETPGIPGSKSWDAAITRVVTWATFRDRGTGKMFYHFNTHFDHIGKESRKRSAIIVSEKIAEARQNRDLACVVTGDFNCQPADEPYELMISGKRLFDARPAESQTGTACTFLVNKQPCVTIDHIFFSVPFRAAKYTVIQDNDGTYYPSDHLPVMVQLTF